MYVRTDNRTEKRIRVFLLHFVKSQNLTTHGTLHLNDVESQTIKLKSRVAARSRSRVVCVSTTAFAAI